MSEDFVTDVLKANPTRHKDQLVRRALKVQEESGELAEAVLGVTSTHNYKRKTWADVREEAIDVAIVALDVALTRLPDDDFSDGAMAAEVAKVIRTKLDKWIKNQKTRQEAIS